jgi:hypothetical protein
MSENNEMNVLINQAKSEARSELLKKFLAKNSKVISSVSILALVGVIGFSAFSFYQKSRESKFSEIFHQALIDQQIGNLEKSKEGLKLIYESSAPNGVRSLASLRYAAMLLDENKKAEAAAIYEKISQCGGCNLYVKDLGGLLAVKTWLSDEEESKKEDLLTRIEKIEAGSKELHYEISEQKAFLYLQNNDLKKAYEVLSAIEKNPEAAQGIKARVTESLKVITSKGYEPQAIEAEVVKEEGQK